MIANYFEKIKHIISEYYKLSVFFFALSSN